MTDINTTLSERGKRYGTFSDNAQIAQSIKNIFRQTPKWNAMSSDKRECLDQIASKISRILTGDTEYIDNWIDISGYSKLVADSLK